MNFTIINEDKLPGEIFYFPKEYAFQTNPRPPFWNSILINDLELLLDINGRVTGIWGFCPHTCWEKDNLILFEKKYGGVICDKFPSFNDRIPIRIANGWKIKYDYKKKWILIGETNQICENIEILSGLIFSIENKILRGIWIKCYFKPNFWNRFWGFKS